ncbi:GNAT family N-acetyltransferase [Bacillus sp. RAR_GA_16]|uniref:GNAT family N-acetyltransferase n=1 Tax=Bacillus sp. RAR_GA_16 TaxID=2876774 RepID=UPI001CCFB70F|nr:GNAT family N-acetyltransferase [Bacillus sp. RAR_GA_16]MCA0171202.1 GNAT family N-acetyltransferase [Bacillus sp. RAR_GA_16]
MYNVSKANMTYLDDIVHVDSEVSGSTSRRDFIKETIEKRCCIVVQEANNIVGFLTYDTNFFDCSFISLIMVSPSKRRKGYASLLLKYMINHSPTAKVFSSTNCSNVRMQKVFEANGFIQSGKIENLDEGDPEIVFFKSTY